MKINRAWSTPNSKTFKIKPIKDLIGRYVNYVDLFNEEVVVVDPFANDMSIKETFSKKEVKYVSNGLDTSYKTDYNLDATDFLKQVATESVDVLLYDPPCNTVDMTTTQASYWGDQKKEITRIMKKGGTVITFGWNSGGIGKSNGFQITEILMVAHGGWNNDTICTVDVRV